MLSPHTMNAWKQGVAIYIRALQLCLWWSVDMLMVVSMYLCVFSPCLTYMSHIHIWQHCILQADSQERERGEGDCIVEVESSLLFHMYAGAWIYIGCAILDVTSEKTLILILLGGRCSFHSEVRVIINEELLQTQPLPEVMSS